jgi:hypothetical protein
MDMVTLERELKQLQHVILEAEECINMKGFNGALLRLMEAENRIAFLLKDIQESGDHLNYQDQCDDCSEPGEQCIDPYLEEIYGEVIAVVLCPYHYQARKDDI